MLIGAIIYVVIAVATAVIVDHYTKNEARSAWDEIFYPVSAGVLWPFYWFLILVVLLISLIIGDRH
jgi:cell shape-determining protein MreD